MRRPLPYSKKLEAVHSLHLQSPRREVLQSIQSKTILENQIYMDQNLPFKKYYQDVDETAQNNISRNKLKNLSNQENQPKNCTPNLQNIPKLQSSQDHIRVFQKLTIPQKRSPLPQNAIAHDSVVQPRFKKRLFEQNKSGALLKNIDKELDATVSTSVGDTFLSSTSNDNTSVVVSNNLTNQNVMAHVYQKCNKILTTFPSASYLHQLRDSPSIWSEWYEDEAWAIPQQNLLDYKFHWWKKEKKLENTQIICSAAKPNSSLVYGNSVLGDRRASIQNWIYDVAWKFDFHFSTYFLTMQILDYYLEIKRFSEHPISLSDDSPELMVICIASLFLAATLREPIPTSKMSTTYLTILKKGAINQPFTFEDILIAQTDIICHLHPKLPYQYSMVEYGYLFLAELKEFFSLHSIEQKQTLKHTSFLLHAFQYLYTSGSFFLLYHLLQFLSHHWVRKALSLRIPASRLAACICFHVLLHTFQLSVKDSVADLQICRLLSQKIFKMHFEADLKFWYQLLYPILVHDIEIFLQQHTLLQFLWKKSKNEYSQVKVLNAMNPTSPIRKKRLRSDGVIPNQKMSPLKKMKKGAKRDDDKILSSKSFLNIFYDTAQNYSKKFFEYFDGNQI